MTGRHVRLLAAVAAASLLCGGCEVSAGVAMLQNGVRPRSYAGCRDTWISGDRDGGRRNYAGSPSLSCGAGKRVLIHFDLSPVAKDRPVRTATLCLADLGYPRKTDGTWPTSIHAYRLSRPWNDDANWLEHTKTDWQKKDEGDWDTPGGDIDRKTDFGHGPNGRIASDTVFAGAGGHVHLLDVTEVVRRWLAGELPNHGLILEAPPKSTGCELAGSEWHVPEWRPALVIDLGADAPPLAPATCMLPPPDLPPDRSKLDPVAATPDAGKASGEYAVVRVGQNANCALRGSSTDAYVKEAAETYPGNWGWMNMCRVGGRAGDVSRALLYFDLKDIPPATSVRRARLVLSIVPYTNRQVAAYRYGAYLLALPDQPGWRAEEVTLTHRRRSAPWPSGRFAASLSERPVAVGEVVAREVTDARGRKQKVNAELVFDLTGAVRAWLARKRPNCGVVLDNRLEGGAYDFYSCRSFRPEKRPYLEITLSPAIRKQPEPIRVEVAPPKGEYWVEPMRRAHGRFRGKPGTLAQYGDSITVSGAFLSYRFATGAPPDWVPPRKEIYLANTPPEVRKELDVIAAHADRHLWFKWKGPQWGCTGMMMSDWLFHNVDAWQKRMNPEASVILFGTNDLGRICPPEYTEYMAASIRRMLADGTVPMLTTVPPASGRAELVRDAYYPACLSIAHGLKVPLIDYYGEIMRRRPDDWNGALEKFKDYQGFNVPTMISRDGTHPAHPDDTKFDFSENALNTNGYVLRDYLTLRTYYQVITKVLKPKGR